MYFLPEAEQQQQQFISPDISLPSLLPLSTVAVATAASLESVSASTSASSPPPRLSLNAIVLTRNGKHVLFLNEMAFQIQDKDIRSRIVVHDLACVSLYQEEISHVEKYSSNEQRVCIGENVNNTEVCDGIARFLSPIKHSKGVICSILCNTFEQDVIDRLTNFFSTIFSVHVLRFKRVNIDCVYINGNSGNNNNNNNNISSSSSSISSRLNRLFNCSGRKTIRRCKNHSPATIYCPIVRCHAEIWTMMSL
jgi:hypothetical protein